MSRRAVVVGRNKCKRDGGRVRAGVSSGISPVVTMVSLGISPGDSLCAGNGARRTEHRAAHH